MNFMFFWLLFFGILSLINFNIALTVGYFLLLIKNRRKKEVSILGKRLIFVDHSKVLQQLF